MIVALVTLLISGLGPAEDEPFVLTELTTPAGEGTAMPSLARGGDGRVYLTWVERRGRATGTLRLSVWNAGAWSDPRTVASGDDWFLNWADFPTLSALADGTLAAAWLQRLGEATYAYGVRYAVSHDGGERWSDPHWLHADRSPVEHGFVSLVPLDRERFGAVWLDGRGMTEPQGTMALYFRTIGRNGELGAEERLDERVCECCPTTLVRRNDGRLRVAYRDRSDEEIRDISFLERSGGAWSAGGRPVHRDSWEMPGCPVNGPRLATLGKRLAAVWYTGAGEGAGGVFVAFDQGARFGPPLRVDDGAPEGRVDAVFLEDGALVVTWLEHEEGASQWRARRLGPDGRPGRSFVIAGVLAGRESGAPTWRLRRSVCRALTTLGGH